MRILFRFEVQKMETNNRENELLISNVRKGITLCFYNFFLSKT